MLELLLVGSTHRGRGLGTELVRRLLTLADAVRKPVLTTARPIGSNSPAVLERLERYYANLGFEILSRGVSSTQMRRAARVESPLDVHTG